MKLRLFILSLACLSCVVPPAFGGIIAAKLAAAGAIKGAAVLGAAALAKAAVKGIATAAVAKGAAVIAAKGAAAKLAGKVLAAKGAAIIAAKGAAIKKVVEAKKSFITGAAAVGSKLIETGAAVANAKVNAVHSLAETLHNHLLPPVVEERIVYAPYYVRAPPAPVLYHFQPAPVIPPAPEPCVILDEPRYIHGPLLENSIIYQKK